MFLEEKKSVEYLIYYYIFRFRVQNLKEIKNTHLHARVVYEMMLHFTDGGKKHTSL